MSNIENLFIDLFRFGLPTALTFFILYPVYSIWKWTSGFSWTLLGGFLVAGFILWLVLVFIVHWIISLFKTDR